MRRATTIAMVTATLVVLSAIAYTLTTTGSASAVAVLCAAPDGDPEATGACWDDPLDLGTALGTAEAGTEVWVREGTYSPGDDPHAAFYLPDGVSVIGGFKGSLERPDERDIDPDLTILDGREQSYTVLIVAGVSDTRLSSMSIRNGAATLIADEASDLQRRGGGVFVSNSTVEFSNVVLSGNYARFGGGGMFIAEGSNVRLEGVVFSGNQTTHPQSGRGGGIRISQGAATLVDVRFEQNRAIRGGGLFVDAGEVDIEGGIFAHNEAADRGGGISVYSGTIRIVDTEFSENLAIREGAGIFVSRAGTYASIQASDFTGNRSGDGGGGAWIQAREIELHRVGFLGNSAGRGAGGGLYSSNAQLSIEASRFQGNQAGVGGGLALRHVEASIFNTLIAGNHAGMPDQVIDLQAGRPPSDDPHRESSISDPWRGVITGEIFGSDYLSEELDERAELAGGGLLAYGTGAVRVINSTIASNLSEGLGAAVYQSGETMLEIGNSILARNTPGPDVDLEDDSALVRLDPDSTSPFLAERSIIESGCPEHRMSACLFVSRDDPLFIDAPDFDPRPTKYGDYRLWFTSPAIDAGRNSLLPVDISLDLFSNDRRVLKRAGVSPEQSSDWIDLGAIEMQLPEPLEDENTEVRLTVQDSSLALAIDVRASNSGSLRGTIDGGTSDWSIEAVRLGRMYQAGPNIVIDGEILLDSGAFAGFMLEIREANSGGREVRLRLDNGYSTDWLDADS